MKKKPRISFFSSKNEVNLFKSKGGVPEETKYWASIVVILLTRRIVSKLSFENRLKTI